MDDRRLEELLRGYRPVSPPPALRARVLRAEVVAARMPGRTWPWVAAAAALLFGALALRVASDALLTRPDIATPMAAAAAAGDRSTVAAIAVLADTLGGDAAAWQTATQMVREEARRIERIEEVEAAGAPVPAAGELP
jgi:hypothetical protein